MHPPPTKTKHRLSAVLLVGAMFGVASPQVLALDWNFGPTTLTLGGGVGLGLFTQPGAVFGTGSYDIRRARDFIDGRVSDLGAPARTPFWVEAYLAPSLRVDRDLGDGRAIFADASLVFAKTMGDGDASPLSTTAGYPGSIGIEEAYVGYRGPLPFGGAGAQIVAQFGRQDFTIDDGFLVQLGRFDVGHSASLYLSPHLAFDGWGTVRFNTSPVRGDIFVLDADTDNRRAYGGSTFPVDQPATSFAGFDIEWFQPVEGPDADGPIPNGAANYLDRKRYLNFTYFNIYRSDRNPTLYQNTGLFWERRDGLNVFSVAGGGNLIPVPDATLYFQYVRQRNWQPGRKVDAVGYYIEPGYTFSDLPWSPHIYYRFSRFSGQPSPIPGSTETKHSYDMLFLGGGIRDFFGNYGLGEIVGNYLTPATNLVVHSASLKLTVPFHILTPTDSLSIELLGYAFYLDRPEQARATSGAYAHEIDLTAQYSLDQSTFAGFAVGMTSPGKGGRQAIGTLLAPFAGVRPIGGDTYVSEVFMFKTF
jgi:hypothetical protein